MLKLKPDIIHSHTPKAGLISMIAGKLCGVPIRIHTVPGLPQHTAKKWQTILLNFSDAITFKSATKILFNSANLLRSQLEKYPKLENKFHIILNGSSNGIDISRFNSGYQFNVDFNHELNKSELFTWIFVGRIHEDKGIRELIGAYLLFEKIYPGKSQLVILGEFDAARNSIQIDWLNKLDVEYSNIHFKGFQSNIPEWFAIADVFLFPSYREGFPNALLEAACYGLPCIATDIDGSNEIIIHGENGLLVPVKDTEKLGKAMKLLYNSPELRSEYSKCRKLELQRKFNREDFHHALYKFYKEQIKAQLERP